jgi:hypothetical protein
MTSLVVVVPALVGCGDDAREHGTGGQSSPPAQSERSAPQALAGTYKMVLKHADLPPDPPPELTDRAEKWTLKIENTGGRNGGPGLALINDELGTLESSPFGVIGDRILLHAEECAVAPAPVESAYTWKRSANTLTFRALKNGCKDEVALTLLTAEPWTKR